MANSKRRCGACKTYFRPEQTFPGTVSWCSPECGLIVAQKRVPAVKAKQARAERAQTKEARGRIKTRAKWMREAQAAWNGYVRARDHGKKCASCGAAPSPKIGGSIDCSHYRSVGSAPHLRFNLHNAAAACVKCNRYLSGNIAALRIGLIDRIGLEKVEALESNCESKKYDIEYLKRIKRIFTARAKRLKMRYNID